MGAYEKLGIELDIIKGTNLDKVLKDIADTLNKAVKIDGFTKLADVFDKLEKQGGGVGKSIEKTSQRIAAISDVINKPASDVKAFMKAFADDAAFSKFFKGLSKVGEETNKVTLAMNAQLAQQVKNQEAAEAKRISAVRKATQEELTIRRSMAQLLQAQDMNASRSAFMTSISGSADSHVTARNNYVRGQQEAAGSDYLASLAKQGLKHVNGTEVAVKQAAKQVGIFDAALGKVFTRLAEFYSIRNVMFAVSSQFMDATTSAIDLKQAVYDIAAISGAPTSSIRTYSDAILDIAKNSRFTTQEVSQLMQVLAQAGVKESSLPMVARETGRLATATGSAPGLTADLVTTGMNVFDIKAENITRITNAMTAALNESKLSTEGLATAFNYLAPQASQLGMSLEQTLGMIATQAQAGIKPSTIGTGLSQLLKDLAAPKPRLANLLKQYGIDPESINPVKHTLDEIADVFSAHKVKVQDLMSAMDSRVGRAMVTSMTLGGDAFREMTANVTGTNAAMTAFDKVMEGPRAKLNVLKQEFAGLASTIGDSVGPALALIVAGLTNLVRGLNTGAGQVVLLTGVVVTLIGAWNAYAATARTVAAAQTALGVATAATPWGAIAIAVSVVSAALIGWGAISKKNNGISEESTKAINKQREAFDGYRSILNGIIKDTTAGNKEAKEFVKVYEQTGVFSEKLVKAGNTELKITDDRRAALTKFVLSHKEYIGVLNTELKTLKETLTTKESLRNLEWSSDMGILAKMNEAGSNIRKYESQLSDSANKATFGTVDTRKMSYSKADDDTKLLKLINQEKERIASLNAVLKTQIVPTDIKYQYAPLGTNSNPDRSDANTDKLGDGKAEKAAEKAKDVLERLANKELKDREAIEASALHSQRILAENNLKEAVKLKQDVDGKKAEALKALDDEYAQRRKSDFVASFTDLANTLGGELLEGKDGKKTVTYDPKKFTQEQVDTAIKDRYLTYAGNEKFKGKWGLENAQKEKELAEINAMAAPKSSAAAPKLLSDGLEKKYNVELQMRQQTLNLMKETSWNAAEINDLDVKSLDLQVEIGKKKAEAFDTDVKRADLYLASHANSSDEKQIQLNEQMKQQRDAINDKLAAEIRLTDDLADKRERLAKLNGSREEQFKEGARSSWLSFADSKTDTTELGKSMTDGALNGMINSLNTLTDSLGKGGQAWKNFGKSLGDSMKDIAASLQTYILKMMVVYAMQKLIGMATSTASNMPTTEQVNGQTISTDFFDTAAVGGLVAFNGIRKYADGGYLSADLGGTPGVDSIPALLMPGEFVVRKTAVDHYGPDFMRKVNSRRLAEGGFAKDPVGKGSSSDGDMTLNIINVVDPRTVPKTTGTEILNVMSFEAEKGGPVFKQWKQKITDK